MVVCCIVAASKWCWKRLRRTHGFEEAEISKQHYSDP